MISSELEHLAGRGHMHRQAPIRGEVGRLVRPVADRLIEARPKELEGQGDHVLDEVEV